MSDNGNSLTSEQVAIGERQTSVVASPGAMEPSVTRGQMAICSFFTWRTWAASLI